MKVQALHNPHRSKRRFPPPPAEPSIFHAAIPGYAPTRLVSLTALAAELGVEEIFAKVENARFGLPAFKILGASWAVAKVVESVVGERIASWPFLLAAAKRLSDEGPFTLAAATDGNHGRAVARVAKLLGMRARIYVPKLVSPARVDAIAKEGAEVVVVDGNYDLAVHTARASQSDRVRVIADVQIEPDDPVPGFVIDGYSTMFREVDQALLERGAKPPNTVFVQIGVGALAAAVVREFRRAGEVRIVGVEPVRAACVMESVRQGKPVTLPGSADSAMSGLNCEAPSLAAWPELLEGIDDYLSIDDGWAFEAMRALAKAGVEAGESGSAGLAGLLAAVKSGALTLPTDARVLVILSEGATDRSSYEAIVGSALKA